MFLCSLLVNLQNAPTDECVLASMRWGLVPAWFKEKDPRKMQFSTSNCRSENILQKKSYKVHAFLGTAKIYIFPVFYILLSVLGACTQCLITLTSLWRAPWWKDSDASSWLMVFMSGRGKKSTSSLSSYTSLRLWDPVRRKQGIRMTKWPQLAIRRMQRQCAFQRGPPPTWQRFVLGFQ